MTKLKLSLLGKSGLMAEKGKFKAAVLIDSEIYQVENDVDTIEEAKRFRSLLPVGCLSGIYDEKGNSVELLTTIEPQQITLTHNQLVSVSNRIHKLLHKRIAQGTIEWALFRAVSDELGISLFDIMPDEIVVDYQDLILPAPDEGNEHGGHAIPLLP
jgi:hypothetical protein